MSSLVSQDVALLRLLRAAALEEEVTNVVAVLREMIDSVEVIVTVLVGTLESVVVLEMTYIEVTASCAAVLSAELQYADATTLEAKHE